MGLIALICFVLYEFPNIRFPLCLIIILISIIFLNLYSQFFIESIGNRIITVISVTDPSLDMRLDSAQAALQVWLRNPILGVGIGNASFYTPEFYQAGWLHYTQDSLFHIAIDSALLTILAENGMIGFIAFIMMILVIIRQPRPVGSLYFVLYKKSLVKETGVNLSYRNIWIYERIFRIIVIVEFIELILSGGVLSPRFWFNIGVYLCFKGVFMKKNVGSAIPSSSKIHGSEVI